MENINSIDSKNKDENRIADDAINEIEKELDALQIDPKTHTNEETKPNDGKTENPNDVDFLDECLTGANEKLNLTADEKDDLEDLDDEQIQKEYEAFMKNLGSNANATDFLGQLNQLMEGGLTGDKNLDGDFGNILGGLDEGNDFDMFTDNLIGQFIDKEVIYEPLKEARQKVDEHVNESVANKTEKNIKILGILDNIIKLMDEDAQKTSEGKEKVMQLFEDLQEQGGLPDEIVKTHINDNPEMAKLQELTKSKGCTIF